MKKFLILILILFFYVFMKSNTIEQKQWKEEKNGVEYFRNSFNLNWNNFANYLKDQYRTVKEKVHRIR